MLDQRAQSSAGNMTQPNGRGSAPGTITRGMLGRAVLTSLTVGGALFAINSGGALVQEGLTHMLLVKLTVTVMIPFAVSLTSAVLTARELATRVSGRSVMGRDPQTRQPGV